MRIIYLKTILLSLIIVLPQKLLSEETATYNGSQGKRIINEEGDGPEVDQGKAPWFAALMLRKGGIICGGGLIGPKIEDDGTFWAEPLSWSRSETNVEWVLTAAHCFYDSSTGRRIPDVKFKKDVYVFTGHTQLNNKKGEYHEIQDIILNPKYDNYFLDYDIALIKIVSKKKMIGDQRQTLRLANSAEHSWITAPYTGLQVYGWGKTGSATHSNKLRTVRVPRADRSFCSKTLKQHGIALASTHFCAGYTTGQYDACEGDSGTPIIFKPTSTSVKYKRSQPFIVGLVSGGGGQYDKCAAPNGFGLYTDIYKVNRWVKKAISEHYKKALVTRNKPTIK